MTNNKTAAVEALSVLSTILTALQANALPKASGATAARLYYAIGEMQAFAPSALEFNWLGLPLAQCFYLARVAGITLAGMAAVRAVALGLSPKTAPAQAIAAAGARFALIQEAKILAATQFVSRTDVDNMIVVYDAAFEAAECAAADAMQIAVYRSLIALHAAVIHDLTVRALPLPSMISYSFGRSYSSIGLAQRLFGDPSNRSP